MSALLNSFVLWPLSTSDQDFVFPAKFMSSTHTDKNNPFTRCTKKHPQSGFFPTVLQQNFSRVAVPTTVLPEDDRTDFAQEERLGLSYRTRISAIYLCRGGRIQMSEHSDIGTVNNSGAIWTWVQADTVSAACPAHPGSLHLTSITFAAVISDADPCSGTYCIRAWIILHTVTSEHDCTSILKFWFRLRIFRWQHFHQWGKVYSLALSPGCIHHLCFVSDFCQLPLRDFHEFSQFFIRCCLCCLRVHCLRHRNKFVHQIVLNHSLSQQCGLHDV